MALTSLNAISSTLVAGPSGQKRSTPLPRIQLTGLGLPVQKLNDKNELPPLSKEQVKANIENDKNKNILKPESGFKIAGLQITENYYKFDPKAYEKEFGKPLTVAEFKRRYGLPNGLIKEQLGEDCPGDKDAYEVNRTLNIPTQYIDKK